MTAAVKTDSVHKIYQSGDQRVAAVDGISLEIAKGEFAAIAGPSGSGKTTLLNLIGALDEPDDGKIWSRRHRDNRRSTAASTPEATRSTRSGSSSSPTT